ncbi:MAG TPA: DUF2786 domain-containing protein [Nitrospira sp.]|nr:DUF2786 domain-containing protein [Nitrospira sp.]
MDDKARILEKIKKCLALGKSSNAHEAAAALRQAQKLMDKHGVSQEEIDALGYGFEEVEIPVQTNVKLPAYISYFVALMKQAFGVRPIMSSTLRQSDYSYSVKYFGPTGRVITAAYAHQVVWRAMNRDWNAHLKANPEWKGKKGARSGFFIGWIDEVWSKVMAIGFTDEEAARTELAVRSTGLKVGPTTTSELKVYNATGAAGREAGSGFQIYRGTGTERNRLR